MSRCGSGQLTRRHATAVVLTDHRLDRLGYAALLARECGVKVVGCEDFDLPGMLAARDRRPNLFVIIADGPSWRTQKLFRALFLDTASAGSILITRPEDIASLNRWMNGQAHGIVSRAAGLPELRRAVRAVLSGRSFLPNRPAAARRAGAPLPPKLPPRVIELLLLLARGLRLREAARRMEISLKTADGYRCAVFQALNIHSQVELMHLAIHEGWVKL